VETKKGPVYNPVLQNGLFEVTGWGQRKRYRAADVAGAKYKFLERFGPPYERANAGQA
jgi:hypothetical protein